MGFAPRGSVGFNEGLVLPASRVFLQQICPFQYVFNRKKHSGRNSGVQAAFNEVEGNDHRYQHIFHRFIRYTEKAHGEEKIQRNHQSRHGKRTEYQARNQRPKGFLFFIENTG